MMGRMAITQGDQIRRLIATAGRGRKKVMNINFIGFARLRRPDYVVGQLRKDRLPVDYTLVWTLGRVCRSASAYTGYLDALGRALHTSADRRSSSLLGDP